MYFETLTLYTPPFFILNFMLTHAGWIYTLHRSPGQFMGMPQISGPGGENDHHLQHPIGQTR